MKQYLKIPTYSKSILWFVFGVLFLYNGMAEAQTKMIGKVALPEQVPYFNPKRPNQSQYVVGNGLSYCLADADGGWVKLCGYGRYEQQSSFKSEIFKIVIDGIAKQIKVDFFRARNTGIFYGIWISGDVRVYLIDHAQYGESWLSRLIMVENTSKTSTHKIKVQAVINAGVKDIHSGFMLDEFGNNCGYARNQGRIAFNETNVSTSRRDSIFTIETSEKVLLPEANYDVSLIHYMTKGEKTDVQIVSVIRKMDIISQAEQSITNWNNWFNDVPNDFKLNKISDQKARDMVESGLALIRMNQGVSGGFFANPEFAINAFVRDDMLACQGLLQTGHFKEVKRCLEFTHKAYLRFGYLPNAVSINDDFANKVMWGNNRIELPSLYGIVMGEYCKATQDFEMALKADKSIRLCIEEQLSLAMDNDYRLVFNGDETEICGALEVAPSGLPHHPQTAMNYWSLTTLALFNSSLNHFINYLTQKGENPAAYQSSFSGQTVNLTNELKNLTMAIDRDFWRTDVPECPKGFHDFYRKKIDMSWPIFRITNFNLFPVYWGTPYLHPERRAKDVAAIKGYFDDKTGFIQMVPGANTGFEGHNLGYLLWCLVDVEDVKADDVYQALVNGSTSSFWGVFNEAHNYDGSPRGFSNGNRTFETGCNVSALAKYWSLGKVGKKVEPKSKKQPTTSGLKGAYKS